MAAQPATTQAPATRRGAYGTSMPSLDNTADEKPAIDPILLKVLDAVPFRLSTEDGIDAARQRFRDLPRRPLHPELRVEDRSIPGPAGSVELRIYWPPSHSEVAEDGGAAPVVLYFHGGGFVMGDLETHDGTARQHAVGADAIVVSVDYRLAPEHPYPAAVEDAWAATLWVAEHAPRARRRHRAGSPLAGDSAGGTISAAMAQRARDHGRRRSRSSCCGIRPPCGTHRCRRSPKTPPHRSWT